MKMIYSPLAERHFWRSLFGFILTFLLPLGVIFVVTKAKVPVEYVFKAENLGMVLIMLYLGFSWISKILMMLNKEAWLTSFASVLLLISMIIYTRFAMETITGCKYDWWYAIPIVLALMLSPVVDLLEVFGQLRKWK